MRRIAVALIVAAGSLHAQEPSRGTFVGEFVSVTLGMGASPMRVEGRSAILLLPAKAGEGAQQWALQFKPAPAPIAGAAFAQLVHRPTGLGIELEFIGGHDWSAWRYGASLERARRLGTSPLSLTGSVGYAELEERTDAARTVMVGDGYLVSSSGVRYQSASTYSTVGRTRALEGLVGLRWAPRPGGFWFAHGGYRLARTVSAWSLDTRVSHGTPQLAVAEWSADPPRVRLGGLIVRAGLGMLLRSPR